MCKDSMRRSYFHQNYPKMTVIIPVYKVDKYLVQCLNSVANQTMEDLEIFIVDEGDRDRCRDIIDFFAAQDPRIVAPHKRHGGYGASVNYGIRRARGEYLAIVESDDFVEPEMCDEMYNYAKKLDADIVKTPYTLFSSLKGKRDVPFREFLRERTPMGQCFSLKEHGELLGVHASIWSAIYRTSYLLKNNIMFEDSGPYLDNVFRTLALHKTERIAYLDKPYYNYRVDNEDSTSNNYQLLIQLKRWETVHEYFKNRKEECDKYYAEHLIKEEYYSTFIVTMISWTTKEEWQLLAKNLSCTREESIMKSGLGQEEKNALLSFKRDPLNTIRIIENRKRLEDRIRFGHIQIDPRYQFPWEEVVPEENIVIYGGG